jgi:hypothetical protein
MKKEREFEFIDFIRLLDKEQIRYLLIGRWAVILHGAPLMTADYDFWVDADSKEKLLRRLQKLEYETPAKTQWKRPILSVFAGVDKIDFFFFRKVTNAEGQSLSFEECWKRAVIKEDAAKGISIRVPSIDDLILLKRMPRSSTDEENKDRADLRYLQQIKKSQ